MIIDEAYFAMKCAKRSKSIVVSCLLTVIACGMIPRTAVAVGKVPSHANVVVVRAGQIIVIEVDARIENGHTQRTGIATTRSAVVVAVE